MSETVVKCVAEYRRDDAEQLVADRAFSDWVRDLPADAALAPIEIDKGSQRDPWPVLIGIRATWEEIR